MEERLRFVLSHHEGFYTMTELCDRFGISRKTGYKWLARYQEGGYDGLIERSRAPHSIPHRTPEHIEQLLVKERKKHPDWGGRTLKAHLEQRTPELNLPAPSTITDVLKRHDLVEARQPRRRPVHPGVSPIEANAPNDVWTADYKGEFLLGNRRYCYPLTVCDARSRMLLGCKGLHSTEARGAMAAFKKLFEHNGLPLVIRTDNGIPFATRAIGGLSRLNVYWIKLGIRHDRIAPASPQQNGRHERMHRTLKLKTTRPPEKTMTAQQKRFDHFRHEYNFERPHHALEMATPSSIYVPSTKELPAKLPRPEYPGHLEVRRIGNVGTFKFKCKPIFLTNTLTGEDIGLEEIDDGIWSIYFYDVLLGRLDQATGTIIP
jgi:putative transposase